MSKALYLRGLLLCALMGAMCWLFMAPSPLPREMDIQRELGFVGHLLIFTIFAIASFGAFPKWPRQTTIVLVLIAICLEAAQMFLPNRGADVMDLIMNGVGIAAGYIIFRALSEARLYFGHPPPS